MAANDNVAVPAGNKGKKVLILIVAGVFLLAGAAGGAWFLLMGDDESTAASGPVTPVLGPVQYLDLAPAFVVNFPHQGRQRFLQANISVMSRDAAAITAVSQHMPVIRHNLINLLSAQMLLVFEDPTGVELLRQLATQEVKQVLQREIGREGIEEVLFTNFVMQ